MKDIAAAILISLCGIVAAYNATVMLLMTGQAEEIARLAIRLVVLVWMI